MYMPGRLRTASSPSRTVMSLAPYDEPFLAGLLLAVRLGARWDVFATQLPFSPISGNLDLRDPARSCPCGHEDRGLTQVYISLPAESLGNSAEASQKPCK